MVNRISNMLKKHGVKKGDRVAIYLPTSPVAIASMLACARIGAIHSVVFAGFSAEALAGRIEDGRKYKPYILLFIITAYCKTGFFCRVPYFCEILQYHLRQKKKSVTTNIHVHIILSFLSTYFRICQIKN